MKIKCQKLDNIEIFSICYNLTKIWISSNCLNISSEALKGINSNFAIYTNASSQLEGWEEGFDSEAASITYGYSENSFNKLI